MTLERVDIRLWRVQKGVPYGTLLWFDERKELPELYKMEGPAPLVQDDPLASASIVLQLDLPLSVSA